MGKSKHNILQESSLLLYKKSQCKDHKTVALL